MTVKHIMIIFGILLSLNKLSSQNNSSVYLEALELHIKKTKSFDKDLSTIYVQKSNHLLNFPDTVLGVKIILVGKQSILKLTKRGKILPIVIIDPIELREDDLTIVLSKYDLTRRRKKWNYASEYGTVVLLRYDCVNDKYTYEIKE